jgi:proline iminopeptidase
LAEVDRLATIPGVLIHGRLDLGGPLRSAWELGPRLAGERARRARDGHTSDEPGECAVDATACFAVHVP